VVPARSPSLPPFRWSGTVAAPAGRIPPARHTAMERRERPVRHMIDQRMFHRIKMHVVQVICIVPVVADRVLPEPPLPDAALAFANPGRRAGLEAVACRRVADASRWRVAPRRVRGLHPPYDAAGFRATGAATARVAKGRESDWNYACTRLSVGTWKQRPTLPRLPRGSNLSTEVPQRSLPGRPFRWRRSLMNCARASTGWRRDCETVPAPRIRMPSRGPVDRL